MSEKPLDPKLVSEPEKQEKPSSQPPESPRTGRLYDDIDKMPDDPAVIGSDIYKTLELIQEAFFPVDQAKRFPREDSSQWTVDILLQRVDDNPFHTGRIHELLRRFRKGLVPEDKVRELYLGSNKRKQSLLDNVAARILGGSFVIEAVIDKDSPNSTPSRPITKLESPLLDAFLTTIFESGYITPDEALKLSSHQELSDFIRQRNYNEEVVGLPIVKPDQPEMPAPQPRKKTIPVAVFRVQSGSSTSETKFPAVKPPVVPPAPPTTPATPASLEPTKEFRVPPPTRKATLMAISAPPPAAGSAPGAPSASPESFAPKNARPELAIPISAPRPPLPPRPATLRPQSFTSSIKQADEPAVTVREGAARTRASDPRAVLPTVVAEEELQQAVGREQTIAAIEVIPPPVSVGVMGSPDDKIPTTTLPPSPGRRPPPPLPHQRKHFERLSENSYQLMHAVTIKGTAGETTEVPLLLDDGEFSVGTNPRNDIVLTNPAGVESVADVHGMIKISGGKMSIKGIKGPFKLEPKPDRKGLVMYNYVPLEPGEPIRVGRVIAGKVDHYVEIDVKLDQPFLNEEIKDQLAERCKSLLRAAGQKIVEAILESDPTKPDLSNKKSDEAKSYVKKAHEFFMGLAMRLPDEFKESDFTIWRNIALSDAQMMLAKNLSATIADYGNYLFGHIRNEIALAISNGTKIAEIKIATEAPDFFHTYINFARVHGINLSKSEFNKELDHATSEARRLLAEKKQVELDIEEADRRRAELEDELRNRPMREHAAALEHFRKIYAGVHYRESGDGSELLNLETKFAHVGPVLVVRDTSGKVIANGIRPLLTNHQTIGTHDINTVELPNDHDPKRGTKPFMASIELDEKTKQYRLTWIDGDIRISNNEGGTGTPTSPVFAIESNRAFFIGKYHLKIEENHAFTSGSITAEHANPHAEELTEIIFDEAVTTLSQTAAAYDELKVLAATGFVDIAALKVHLARKISDLWASLEEWNPNESLQPPVEEDAAPLTLSSRKKVMADAQALGTLHLLLKDRGGFIPRTESISQASVIEAARKRLDAYVAFDNKSKEPGPRFPRITALFAAGKARINEMEKQKEDAKVRANIGVVEVARFLDMGVFKQEFVNGHASISEEYCDRINEIYQIRKLIDEIRNGGKDIESFELAMRLCGNKTMDEIFGPDEIAAFNVNIEVNVNAKTPAVQYLKKLLVFLGRSHVRLLGNIENQKSIATIDKLLAIKAITFDDIVVPPYFTGGEIKSTLEDAKMLAQIKADAEAEEAILRTQKIDTLQKQAEIKRIRRQALVEKFAQAVDAVGHAQQETRLDILLEVADIINDPNVAEEMDGDGISMEMIRYQSQLPTVASRFKDRAIAIVADRQQVGWHKFKEDYKVVAKNTARSAAEKIMATHPDSAYELSVLEEAIQKGIVDPADIGYTADQLKQKVEQVSLMQKEKQFRSKYRPFFDENKVRAADNLDYFDQIKLDQIQDPTEKQVAQQIIEDLSFIRMTVIIEKIQSGDDVAYMKIVGNELLEKGYRAQLHFSPQQLALLQ